MAEIIEWLFLAGRLVFGGFFVMNGLNHVLKLDDMSGYAQAQGVPAPRLAVLGSGLVLLAGGIGVITGLFPHASLALLIAFLVPTSLVMHRFWTVEDEMQAQAEMTQFMKNVALLGAALALFVVDVPWVLSLA